MKKIYFFLMLLLATNLVSFGQIAAWNFFGESSPATSTADVYNASLDASNVMTRGSGAASSSASNSFRTTGFQNNGIATSNTDYFQFTLSAATGNTLSLTTIDTRVTGTATFCASPGVTQQYAYSLDGSTFTLIGSPTVTIGTNQTFSVDLSGISALQNVSDGVTVTFRFYASGQTTTGGWGYTSPTSASTDNGVSIAGTISPTVTPSLGVSQPSLGFGTLPVGSFSTPSLSFNLSGTNLTGAPGNITVNSPSTDFQVANDNATWGASTTIAYATATLSATPVYVRFSPQTVGSKSGDVTFSGGGVASPPTVAVSGIGTITYYSQAAGSLATTTTWGTNTDGTGTAPSNFTSDGQLFIVTNRSSTTLDANWTVSGAGAKVIIGNGASATELIIPSGFVLTGTCDVANNGTLTMQNTTLPTLGTFSSGSTVNFAQAGTSVIPAGTYHNLTLTNGTKTLASGTTTINGNLVVDAVTGFNGSASPFSTVNLFGSFTLQNAAAFEPNPTGDGNRLTLICSGSSTQSLVGGDFQLFRLQTPTTPVAGQLINLSSANLLLGNASGGGLNLQQATHTLSLNGGSLTIRGSGFFSATNIGTIAGHSLSNLVIDKTSGSTGIGSIGFTSGARALNNLTYNSAGTGSNNLTLLTDLFVVGNLTLTNGNINTTAVNLLTYEGSSAGGGGSAASHINGPMARTGSTDYTFPIGNATLYRPISVSGLSGSATITASYTQGNPKTAFGTALAAGIDHIGVCEYWDLDDGASSVTGIVGLEFGASCNANGYVNDPATLLVAHWNSGASQWDNLGTDGSATSTTVKALTASTFSPFTIGSSSNLTNPLPVSLFSFSGYKSGSVNKLQWTTSSEQNNVGFDVQRSMDGMSYTSIGFVNTLAPGGNSATNLNYNFTDNSVAGSKQFYRLRQVDIDNRSRFSNVVLIKGDKPTTIALDGLFPNPASSIVNVLIAAPGKDKVTVMITDMAGRTVAQQLANVETGSNTIPVDISRLTNGTYIVKLVCSSAPIAIGGAMAVGKFVKQ